MVDFLWKIDYPTSLILAFVVFLIPFIKKEYLCLKLIIGFVLIFGVAFLKYIPSFQNSNILNIVYYFINIGLLFGLAYFTIKDITISGTLFITSCAIALQFVTYKLVVGLFLLINRDLLSVTHIYLPVYFSFIVVIYVLTHFFFARRISFRVLTTNNITSIIGVSLLLVVSVIVNLFTYDLFFIEMENIKLISSLVNFTELITIIAIIFFLYTSALSKNRKEENALLKLLDEKDEERYELAKITIDDINIKYHDLQHALKNNNLDEEEQKEIKETLTNYKTIVNTSNRGLNVVIYESQLKCIAKGIDLNVLIDGDPLTFMKSHHVYSLFSNLLMNSIEAVENLEFRDLKRIFLNIKKQQENIIIRLINHCDKDIKFSRGYPLSSKKDSNIHGYGIRSVEKIVNRYNGNLSYKVQNKQFITEIIIPIIKEN